MSLLILFVDIAVALTRYCKTGCICPESIFWFWDVQMVMIQSVKS